MRSFSVVLLWSLCAGQPTGYAQLPTNNDPSNQIRFKTAEEAEERRQKLIRFIWEDGLPTAALPAIMPNVTSVALSSHLESIDADLVRNVDRLQVEALGLTSLIYLIHPVKQLNTSKLVIVHAGHSPPGQNLNDSYQSTMDFFLERGYHVIMVHMPMHGWNDDNTAVLPDGREIILDKPKVKKHEQIVRLVDLDESLEKGAGFRPFLAPVVACINYWYQIGDGDPDVTMIGLSGGGWTTHMMAAIDTRIALSFPVAGSYPLYLRNISGYAGSVGDMEQFYGPLYNEDIAPDGTGGGVATWLEIYALGGLGKGRRQIMVTAQYDNCCFNGDPAETVDTFVSIVADAVESVDPGFWQHRLDTTHHEHKISTWVLNELVKPNLLPMK
jgi:hypothetical protein